MSHLDPDLLALLALGEPVATPADLEHLDDCASCARELSEMRHTVAIARSTIDAAAVEAPPQRVWHDVVAELGIASASTAPASSITRIEESASGVVPAPHPPEPAPRPRRRRVVWVLAASVLLIAGTLAGAGIVLARLAPTAVAEASLEALPAHQGAEGRADVERARDGSLTLNVSIEASEASDAYREVWLIRNDQEALISLGVLDGDSGSFSIPRGVDLDEYSLVDVSVEPVDGDPTHSGDSIVRGKLSFD